MIDVGARVMEQIEMILTGSYLVGCRVDGEIQHFHVDAETVEEARAIVALGVPGANPVLAIVGGRTNV